MIKINNTTKKITTQQSTTIEAQQNVQHIFMPHKPNLKILTTLPTAH
jgi:hypothetical protein